MPNKDKIRKNNLARRRADARKKRAIKKNVDNKMKAMAAKQKNEADRKRRRCIQAKHELYVKL